MPPLNQADTFDVSLTPSEAHDRILGWFTPYQHRVVVDTPDRLEVATGSQAKMRLLGGAFIAASSLPTRTTVTLEPNAAGTRVRITAQDAVGFGIKTGMNAKYRSWIADIVHGVRDTLT